MDAVNLGFLARQLLGTELAGRVEAISGGSLHWGEQLWAGIWQPEELGDAERFVQDTQAAAEAAGVPWAGSMIVTLPQLESDPAIAALAEALYVYGYPRAQGLVQGGPDAVMVMTDARPQAAVPGVEIAESTPDACQRLADEALAAAEQLTAPWRRYDGWLDGCQLLAAATDGEPLGLVAVYHGEVASRVMLLWVTPDARGRGLGGALLAQAGEAAQHSGRMLLSSWVHRDGRLRYYLARHGFADQLSVLAFPAE
jgi:GNAT superfamily N-acetyltransferase